MYCIVILATSKTPRNSSRIDSLTVDLRVAQDITLRLYHLALVIAIVLVSLRGIHKGNDIRIPNGLTIITHHLRNAMKQERVQQ